MRKLSVLIVLLAVFTVYGCGGKPALYEITRTDVIRAPKLAEISVVAASKTEITVRITNITDDVIEIDWVRSTLAESGVIAGGQRIKNADSTTMPPSIITPRANTEKNISMTQGMYWNDWSALAAGAGYWSYADIPYPATLVIKIIQGDKEEFAILSIDAKPETSAQAQPQQ